MPVIKNKCSGQERAANVNLAKWAAQQQGFSDGQTAVYINEIIALDLIEGKDEPVLERICQDLETSGHPAGQAEIAARMNEFMEQALTGI